MAVVQSLGIAGRGCGGSAHRRGRAGVRFTIVAVAVLLSVASSARASTDDADRVRWIAPAALDDVPVRAIEPPPLSDGERGEPIVVPLPPAAYSGAMTLAALGATRVWQRVKRRGRAQPRA